MWCGGIHEISELNMKPNVILYVYKGEWGLPSIDFECLRCLCAVKFTKAPIVINTSGNPFYSGQGLLPYIQSDDKKYVGYDEIIKFLEDEGYSVNNNLLKNAINLSEAYEILVFNNLQPYFQYVMFGDPKNTDETRTLYAKRTPFPFNFYYPGKYVNRAEAILEVFSGFSIHEKIETHETSSITFNAKKCINLLSKKLGDKRWFFGSEPSKFDMLVYSYLSVLLNISLPNNPLQLHIRECPKLVKYIDRITKTYFATEGYSSKNGQGNPTATDSSGDILTSSEQNFMASKRKTQILAGVFAFIAMSSYAAWTGLVKISTDGQFDDSFEYEDDDEVGDN